MAWQETDLQSLSVRNDFRIRGESMTRTEVFSDAAFAFALTMLVVSVGSIPETYQQLMLALKSIPAFAMSFVQLGAFWLAHRVWSQRYGLDDTVSTLLTLLMIFVILVFVYPLRLIFSTFCAYVTQGWLPSEFVIQSMDELAGLFFVYGAAYAILAGIIACLYLQAFKNRVELGMNEIEILRTREAIIAWLVQVGFALASILVALLVEGYWKNFAGFVYFGLAIVMPWLAIRREKKVVRLKANDKQV